MKKYLYLIKINIETRLDYRQEFLTSLLSGILIFTAYAVFWSHVFKSNESVGGYSYAGMITYYLVVRVISDLGDSRVGFEISQGIQDGTISNFIIKPSGIIKVFFSKELGRLLFDLFFKTIIFVPLYMAIWGIPEINLGNLPLFLLILVPSIVLSYNVYFIVGCFAFWIVDSKALNYVIRRVVYLLAGGIVPISFFPASLQSLMRILPFKYLLDVPINILIGQISSTEFLESFVIIGIWTVILTLFANYFLKYSYKHNEAVGI